MNLFYSIVSIYANILDSLTGIPVIGNVAAYILKLIGVYII